MRRAGKNSTTSNGEHPDVEMALPVRRPRSLLVEDQVGQLDRRKELLRAHDLEVFPATSKGEALGRLRSVNFKVDVVIADLNLQPDESSLGGVEVAEVVADHSGRSIPIYAYSGKVTELPAESRYYFKQVVLKSESARAVRELFESASRDAARHFEQVEDRAMRVAQQVAETPLRLKPYDVFLLTDIIAGSRPSRPDEVVPDAVGILRLGRDGELGVPYGVTTDDSLPQGPRTYARPLGHEYLYGYGEDPDGAVASLREVLLGFATLIEKNGLDAVGPSRRMRKLLHALLQTGDRADK
jgi:CheY-like chemotaxis protein